MWRGSDFNSGKMDPWGEATKFYHCWSGQENLIEPDPDRLEWLFVLQES